MANRRTQSDGVDHVADRPRGSRERRAAGIRLQTPRCGGTLLSGDALVLEGVTRAFGALRAVDDVSLSVAAGREGGDPRLQRRRQDDAVQRHHRRLPAHRRARSISSAKTSPTLPPHERIRKGLRRTYQSSLLFRDLTVRDNLFLAVRGVASGRFSFWRPARDARVDAWRPHDLLERVRLAHIADEPRRRRSSHGQQRQLEIGMALAGAPRLILFDEPAAGLSPAERRELVALLASLPRAHGLRADRARPRHRAARRRARDRDAQRPRAEAGTPDEIENDAEVQAIYMGGKH